MFMSSQGQKPFVSDKTCFSWTVLDTGFVIGLDNYYFLKELSSLKGFACSETYSSYLVDALSAYHNRLVKIQIFFEYVSFLHGALEQCEAGEVMEIQRPLKKTGFNYNT